MSAATSSSPGISDAAAQEEEDLRRSYYREVSGTSDASSSGGGCDSCCACCTFCRRLPCSHIQRQLGLVALDRTDAMRVYVRFVSLLLGLTSFFYLLLLLGFTRWFDYTVSIVILSLTFCCTFVTACLGVYASKRRQVDGTMLETAASPHTFYSAYPPHPRALLAFKYSNILPLHLLSFFLAVFIMAAMFGWMEFDTTLTTSSRRQTVSVLLLGINSLVGIVLQCCSFLASGAWQMGGKDQDLLDAEWEQEADAHLHSIQASGVRHPTIDSAE